MKDFWNERYSNEVYAYGTEPNQYFKNSLERYKSKGNLLLPAEGEGRNAVHAAKQGLQVSAFDISVEGQKKALQLAAENNVKINYEVGSMFELDFSNRKFDAIALIFAHFPVDLLSQYHRAMMDLLKPGGLVILEGFSKKHLEFQKINPQAGGPKNIEMLFSMASIRADFNELEVLELEEKEVELTEGPYHQGMSSVVHFVGRKQAK
jgi:SAM-dependent methyltransferase